MCGPSVCDDHTRNAEFLPGIASWEILEDKLPFPELNSNVDVVNYVCNQVTCDTQTHVVLKMSQKGHPERPTRVEVPETLWQLICSCWTFEPSGRPSFRELVVKVEELHLTVSKQKADSLSKSLPDEYLHSESHYATPQEHELI